MNVSTLTLAIAVFQQNDLRVIEVNRSHATNYHLYYMMNGVKRVLLVPKHCERYQQEQLQCEVQTLISRGLEEQQRIGNMDCK
jgi:hypothetical protein